MTLYVSMVRNGGTVLSKYEGISQEAANILCLDLGATNVRFISAQEFIDIQKADTKPDVGTGVIPPDIQTAKDVLKNKTSIVSDKVDAIIKVLGLDS